MVLGLLWSLPDRVAVRGMRWFGRVAASVCRSRRQTAQSRVQECLGVDADRASQIARGAFVSMSLNMIEPELLRRRMAEDDFVFDDHFVIEGREHLQAALASGRGVVFCGGHFGAWEVFPSVMAQLGHPIWIMARAVANPHVEAWLAKRVRVGTVRGVVPKEGGIPKLARALKRGEPMALLLDQRARGHGVVLPFLGRPASHFKTAGMLSRRFGALLMPFYVLRERPAENDDWAYRVVFEAPIEEPLPELTARDAEIEMTRRVSVSLEAQVRRHPDQWLWLHDRWKAAWRGEDAVGPTPSVAESLP